jgi:hypothetical protein
VVAPDAIAAQLEKRRWVSGVRECDLHHGDRSTEPVLVRPNDFICEDLLGHFIELNEIANPGTRREVENVRRTFLADRAKREDGRYGFIAWDLTAKSW